MLRISNKFFLAGVVLDYDVLRNTYVLNSKRDFIATVESKKRVKLIQESEQEGTVVLSCDDYFVVMLQNFRLT